MMSNWDYSAGVSVGFDDDAKGYGDVFLKVGGGGYAFSGDTHEGAFSVEFLQTVD